MLARAGHYHTVVLTTPPRSLGNLRPRSQQLVSDSGLPNQTNVALSGPRPSQVVRREDSPGVLSCLARWWQPCIQSAAGTGTCLLTSSNMLEQAGSVTTQPIPQLQQARVTPTPFLCLHPEPAIICPCLRNGTQPRSRASI